MNMEMLTQLDKTLTEYLVKKAPPLPEPVKEFVVKVGPWVSLIMGLLLLPVILAVLGMGMFVPVVPITAGFRFGALFILGVILAGIQMVLQFMAISGLLKRKMSGWKLMFYATLTGAVYSIITINILGLLIGTGLGLYVLYQIKSYYK